MRTLADFLFATFNSAVDLRGQMTELASESRNLMPLGTRQNRPFRGLTLIGLGGRQLFPIRDTWGTLDDYGGNPGRGSLFSTLADALIFVGNGQVNVESNFIAGAVATANPKILLKWNGSYSDANSGPFIMGLAQPSAPSVGVLNTPTAGGTPTTNGLYSLKCARLRQTTGGKSRASATSVVLNLVGKAAYMVIPAAVDGQTVHPIFVTSKGLGGVGLHYRMARANPFTGAEYTESDVQRSIATLSVTNGSPTVTSSAPAFTAADVGKRFSPTSAGFTVPAGTTILTVNSTTQITLSANVTVSSGSNPRTAQLISYVNSIDRAVCLNWSESDLAGEAAETSWIYDYPPEASSHAFQLENRIVVASYADASASALTSSTNPGTALLFSLSNQIESFDLRFPMYLPEQIVDVIGRGLDSYRFIGTRNGIYAVQYIDSEIPATLSVILPTEGIQTPNNWCLGKRGLYLFPATGKLIRLGENTAYEEDFADPVRRYIENWDPADTVLASYPRTSGVVIANGMEALYFDEMTRKWSSPLRLDETDAGVIQNPAIASALGTRGGLVVCIDDPDNDERLAYDFDVGGGSYVLGVSPWVKLSAEGQAEAPMNVQQIAAEFLVDDKDQTVFIGVHANMLQIVWSGDITTASNEIVGATNWLAELLGQFVLIQGGVSGEWVHGRITSVVNTKLTIGTPTESLADSVALPMQQTLTGTTILVGRRFFPVLPYVKGVIAVESPEITINGCHQLAASLLIQKTDGTAAHPMGIALMGDVSGEGWAFRKAIWGTQFGT